ncbi:MAG: PilT/PilU family type 4a pilus ATPase [Candidatus Sumerlaeia bacterium]|nr:PilT/PilU family type 4a pilus ATPase [Candidatus Sumerlaeia bacterium]
MGIFGGGKKPDPPKPPTPPPFRPDEETAPGPGPRRGNQPLPSVPRFGGPNTPAYGVPSAASISPATEIAPRGADGQPQRVLPQPRTPQNTPPSSQAAPPPQRSERKHPSSEETALPGSLPQVEDLRAGRVPAPSPGIPSTAANAVLRTAPRPQAAASQTQVAVDLRAMLKEAVRLGASDLHLTRNMPPMIRLDGFLRPLEAPPLTDEQCTRLVMAMLTPEQKSRFNNDWELDLSADLADVGRFRVNVHRQRGNIEAAFRVVNDVILPIKQLGLPKVVEDLARKNSGLVVVTGPTGSGKTTSLAAIIDQINHERQCMVVTVEDPIEYIHRNHRAIVKQREVTSDTHSFAAALRHVLRQDPDVIVIGEMRDIETISTSLLAAETGHMVYTTLHTPDAVQTIDRIIDVFPPHHQEQTRIQLANTLEGVVAQQLLPVPGNRGRALAAEILIATTAVRKIIRAAKSEQLMTIIQTGGEQGMVSMDKSLKSLYLQGLITFEDAITRCKNPEHFDNI